MSDGSDDSDKSFDPTPQKLEKARKKGDIPRSTDLQAAAAYLGLAIALFAFGQGVIQNFGTGLMVLMDQVGTLDALLVSDHGASPMGGILWHAVWALAPIFATPALAVILVIIAQRAFLVTPEKLMPKLSRINPISNAKQKFGRSGLFEFFKSLVKMLIYSACLAIFLTFRMPDIMSAVTGNSMLALQLLAELCITFLMIVVLISAIIGAIDITFQHQEHLRKNRMSRKEIQDEQKDAEGDPHLKQERRQRAQSIAMSQMMSDVPTADVVIVNPTHYAVALKWSRLPGSAPECVAKGTDEIALRIREVAQENGVPIHSDPPTARKLHATVNLGEEIQPDQYRAVAAAIRFAQTMRERAKGRVY